MLIIPDVWQVIELTQNGSPPLQKVLAGWYGGYTGSDAWKISSGIQESQISYGSTYDEFTVDFLNASGSVYRCHSHNQRFSGYTQSIFDRFVHDLEASGLGTMRLVDDHSQFFALKVISKP